MICLPLAQLLQNQNPTASNLLAKIPHPFHLTVPVVDPPNKSTSRPPPLRRSLPDSPSQYPLPHLGPPPPPLYLPLPCKSHQLHISFAILCRHLVFFLFHFTPHILFACLPPTSAPSSYCLHSSPSALPSPR